MKTNKMCLRFWKKNPEKTNFAFSGPPGSGKTVVALKCCNNIIQKYLKDERTEMVFVYAIVFDEFEEMQLLQIFQKNIYQSSKITSNCVKFSDMEEEMVKQDQIYNTAKVKEKIQAMISYLETQHEKHPCIILFDEAQLYIGDNSCWRVDWSDLGPTGEKIAINTITLVKYLVHRTLPYFPFFVAM